MAISRPGPLVTSISGELSGVVFYQGARAGVIGRRPRASKSCSPEQRRRQLALLTTQGYWRELLDKHRASWNLYASTLPWTNRIGVRRPISGYSAFLSFHLHLDPFAESGVYYTSPPLNISAPTPVISAAAFTAGGTCIITTQAPPPTGYLYERLTIQFNAQYGPRTAPGQTRFIGAVRRTATTLNWSTLRPLLPGMFVAGEILTLSIFWMYDYNWPSQNAKFTTTAL